MKKSIWVLALLAGSALPAQAQDPRLVTMTGYGSIQSAPDRAWITVGVEKRDPTTKIAQEQTALATDHILQRLKSLGIPAGAIRTSSFNVTQDWEFQPNNRRNLRGYIVSNQMEIKVDDVAKISAVIDGAIDAGANIVHGIRWDLKNRDALEQDALKLAFEDARRRAQVIASASGSGLGRVYAVQESRAGQVRPAMPMRFEQGQAAARAMAESVPISAGELEIRAVVTVSFVIQN
jgi:uncharacterized protein YggE